MSNLISAHSGRYINSPQDEIANTAKVDTFAILINVAGRQRMLSQRILLFALLSAKNIENASQFANEALDTFERSHSELSQGRFAPLLISYWQQHPDAAQKITSYAASARIVLSRIRSRQPVALDAWIHLVAEATALLDILNAVTQQCEVMAKVHAATKRKHLLEIIQEIDQIATIARLVSMNARVLAARAGSHGAEFGVLAGELTAISERISSLAKAAVKE